MSLSMAATALLMILVGVAPSAADCLSARQAHVMARCGVGEAVIEETAASERYIAARSELEAARLRRERAERRARYAARDHTGERDVCRHLDDDPAAFRSCEGQATAVYDRAVAARRHAWEAVRDASSARTRPRSALSDSEQAVSSARNVLRDPRRRVRQECRP